MIDESILREQLVYLLNGGGAHISFSEAIHGISHEEAGRIISGMPHTIWDLIEHLRIAQWDILEFIRNQEHTSPKFPEGYWPREHAPDSKKAFRTSIESFQNDLNEITDIVKNTSLPLSSRIPHGEGQTVIREIFLVTDHNAYHLGQIIDIKKLVKREEF